MEMKMFTGKYSLLQNQAGCQPKLQLYFVNFNCLPRPFHFLPSLSPSLSLFPFPTIHLKIFVMRNRILSVIFVETKLVYAIGCRFKNKQLQVEFHYLKNVYLLLLKYTWKHMFRNCTQALLKGKCFVSRNSTANFKLL